MQINIVDPQRVILIASLNKKKLNPIITLVFVSVGRAEAEREAKLKTREGRKL